MKKWMARLLAMAFLMGIGMGSGLAELSFDGMIVAGETIPVLAAFGGQITGLRVEAGDLVSEGQVLAEIRRYSKVPVIMLTALGEDRDEIKGFELDADEYVTKPFSPRVLMARVAAILRRQEESNAAPLVMGGLRLDRVARELTVDGKPVDLSLKEYELMQYFMENPGVALSRESILNHVWNYNYYGDARTIDTHVKKLRSKLGAYGERIRTLWGVGYKLEAEAPDHEES